MRTQIATAIVFTFMVAALTMLPANAVGNQAPAADTRLDAEQLPVSLERIKRKLDRLAVAANDRSVLRLRFYVEVYGRAPRINIFEGFDVHNGPVPYGAPTHTTMRDVATPIEFRSPVANIGNVIGWGVEAPVLVHECRIPVIPAMRSGQRRPEAIR